MSRTILFFVDGKPEPAGSKRGFAIPGKGVRIVDANAKARPWKAMVAAEARIAMNGDPPMQGPLEVLMEFTVTRPQGHTGKRGLLASAPSFPAVRPDLLKLARGVEDAMTGLVYRDDAQIIEERLLKRYGTNARLQVRVKELE